MITRKTKILGVSSLLLFVVSATGVFVSWQYVQDRGVELNRQATEVANFQAREQVYRKLEDLVKSTKEDRLALEKYVLTEEKTIDFLSTMEQIAIEHGIELTTNSLSVTQGTDLFDTLSISYSIEGGRFQVASMLLLFESLPYQTFLSSISLSYSSDESVDFTRGTIELTASLLRHDR